MKKSYFLMIGAALIAASLTSCVHCAQPKLNAEGNISEECLVGTHDEIVDVDPNSLAIVRPGLLPSKDYFRPQFRAGVRRASAFGIGKTIKLARENALKNFLEENECDFIVAVNFREEEIRHPQAAFWRWFFPGSKSYKTSISGIPIILESLEKEEVEVAEVAEVAEEKEEVSDAVEEKLGAIVKLIEENKKETEEQFKAIHRPGLLKLTDIDISVKAKGETDDNTGIIFPALPCDKIACEGQEEK